jgi:hypothetical protein
MNLVKSPHQILLEQAGLSLDSIPGLANTPQQMMPQYAPGGSVQQNLSPADMQAAMIVNGQTPQHFATGGHALKHLLTSIGLGGLFAAPDIAQAAQHISEGKKGEAAGDVFSAASMFAPAPIAAGLFALSPSELGSSTLDAYKKQEQMRQIEEQTRQAQEQYKAALNAQRPQRQAPLTFEETRFYKK